MKKINQRDVCTTQLPNIDLKEQIEIIESLYTIRFHVELTKTAQEEVKEMLQGLEKSMLERAFKGEI
jgi:restriction endonuclease S subunit